ncbi:DUF1648 domain-containing protein [Streptomyces alboflavus]|uniref:DUF1648 domain-containing protein n=1 Tax=Streptomyces alboflavus TaxID=67267 RepID=UPI0036ACB9A8
MTAGPLVIAAVVYTVAFVSLFGTFPDKIATHFGSDGPDGYMTPVGAWGFTVGLFAVEVLAFGYPAWRRAGTLRGLRFNAIACWALAGLTGYLTIALLFANRGLAHPNLIDFPLSTHLPAAAVAAALASGVGATLMWRIQ